MGQKLPAVATVETWPDKLGLNEGAAQGLMMAIKLAYSHPDVVALVGDLRRNQKKMEGAGMSDLPKYNVLAIGYRFEFEALLADGRAHELKTWPGYFNAVATGIKTFEVRYAGDRDFKVGDWVLLHCWDPHRHRYMGNHILVVITYITGFEQKPGFVVFGFKVLHAPEVVSNYDELRALLRGSLKKGAVRNE
jgi:hypothetical protein